jgi:hypothetical protein
MSRPTTAARLREYRAALLREASERVHDPDAITARMGSLTTDQQSVLWRLYRSSRSQLTAREDAMRRELLGLFRAAADEIQGDISRTFAAIGKDNWSLQLARRLGRQEALFKQIDDRIKALGGRLKKTFDDRLSQQYKRTYADAAYRMDMITPGSAQLSFGLMPDREIVAMLSEPWSGARFSDRLGLITSEMRSNIKHELLRSMMAEESWQAAARRIRSEMGTTGQRSVWRAEMISRTELARAQDAANAQFAKDNDDIIEREIWVAHPGACEDVCKPKHGKDVEDVGRPPEDSHPNCVCATMAIPKSWGKLAKAGDKDFSITPTSRKAWVADNLPEAEEA